MNYQIISDSSCDLPTDIAENKKLIVVPFYVSFDDTHYKKEIVEVGIRDFYEEMVANPKIFPKTSLPSAQDYVDAFEPLVKAGTPIGKTGVVDNTAAVVGILLHDVLEDRPQGTVLKKAYINTAVAEAHAGIEYAAAVKTALPMVVFE